MQIRPMQIRPRDADARQGVRRNGFTTLTLPSAIATACIEVGR